MAALDSKKVYNSLKRKGFKDAINKSNDHKWLELYYNGKFVLMTKLSHGSKEIGDSLIKYMSSQCKLSKPEFIDLINCPLSHEDHIEILKKINPDLVE